jgi:hypothetical protein
LRNLPVRKIRAKKGGLKLNLYDHVKSCKVTNIWVDEQSIGGTRIRPGKKDGGEHKQALAGLRQHNQA